MTCHPLVISQPGEEAESPSQTLLDVPSLVLQAVEHGGLRETWELILRRVGHEAEEGVG
jgi:hypothetical protein